MVREQELEGGARLVGMSATADGVRNAIRRAAATDSNVLITGETGTSKELVAELIHRNSAACEAADGLRQLRGHSGHASRK